PHRIRPGKLCFHHNGFLFQPTKNPSGQKHSQRQEKTGCTRNNRACLVFVFPQIFDFLKSTGGIFLFVEVVVNKTHRHNHNAADKVLQHGKKQVQRNDKPNEHYIRVGNDIEIRGENFDQHIYDQRNLHDEIDDIVQNTNDQQVGKSYPPIVLDKVETFGK